MYAVNKVSACSSAEGLWNRLYKVMSRNTIAAVAKTEPREEDDALEIITTLEEDKTRIWNSVEVHGLYAESGGTSFRRLLVSKLPKEK